MPKELNYSTEESCSLAEILLKKMEVIISTNREKLKTCRKKYKQEIKKEIAGAENISVELRDLIKKIKSNEINPVNRIARQKIMNVFDKLYPIGDEDRGRITAQIRMKRNRKEAKGKKVQKPLKQRK